MIVRLFRHPQRVVPLNHLFVAMALVLTATPSTAWAQPAGQNVETAAKQGGQSKSGYKREPGFGSPDSVGSQLEDDDRVKQAAIVFPEVDEFLKPWFEWKKKINQEYGLKLGTDYAITYQGASDSLTGKDNAASGIFRFFGKWDLTGRGTKNTGSLVFKVEHRHKLGADTTPAQLAGNVGYLGVTGLLFSDAKLILNDFNWQQRFNDGKGGLLIGRFDPNDYVDVLGYANPLTGFQNLAILLNTSIALPDTSWGIGGGTWMQEQWYVLGSMNDANGTVDDFDFFEDGTELFTTLEAGWSPSRADRYKKNLHVTYWHVDERSTAGVPKGDGVAMGGNWMFGTEWMIFGRAGWSDGLAPLMQKTATVGFAHLYNTRSDILGLGLNWGDPANEALREQTTTEFFYRFQLAQNFAITPSIQWLVDPTLNPNEDSIRILGLRMRLSL